MDIAHQREGKDKIHKSECPYKEGKFEEPGNETDQEHRAHPQIQTPFYNLHIHENRQLFSAILLALWYKVMELVGPVQMLYIICLVPCHSFTLNWMVTSTGKPFLAYSALLFLISMIINPGFGEPKCTNMDEVACVRMDSKKWGIMTKAVVLMLILLIPRTVIDFYGLDVVPINTVVGAFISGAIFTIAIIFTGTFTDFKESEKVGGDLAASLKALYNDSRVLPLADEAPAQVLRAHVRDLHRTMQTCFSENTWNLPDINREMDKINNDIRILSYLNVAPPLIAKLRNELGVLDRMTNRIEVIIRTDFIPAAYALAEVATGSVILLLLFINMDPYLEGVIIFAVICSMLIGLLLLIRDMDNPFEIGSNTYADVDLETLSYLTTYFDEQDAEMESGRAGS